MEKIVQSEEEKPTPSEKPTSVAKKAKITFNELKKCYGGSEEEFKAVIGETFPAVKEFLQARTASNDLDEAKEDFK